METPFKRTFRGPGAKKIHLPPNVMPEETIDCEQLWNEEVEECNKKYARMLLLLEQDTYQIRSDEEGELEYIFLKNLSAILHPSKIKHSKSVICRGARRTSSLKRSKPVDKIDGSRLRLTVNDRANNFLKVETPDDRSFHTRSRAAICDDIDFVSEETQSTSFNILENQKISNVSAEARQTDVIQEVHENSIVQMGKPTFAFTIDTPSLHPNFPSQSLEVEQTNNDLKKEAPQSPIKGEVTPIEREVTSFKGEITPNKTDITPIEREITPIKREVAPIERDVASIKKEVVPIEREVNVSEQSLFARKESKSLKPETNPPIMTNTLTEMKRSDLLEEAAADPLTALLDHDQQDLNVETSVVLLKNPLKKIPQNEMAKKDIPNDLPKFGPPSSYRSFRKSKLDQVQSVDTGTLENRSANNQENSPTSSSLLRSNFQRNRPSSFSVFDKCNNDQPSMSDRLRNVPSRKFPLSKDRPTINEVPHSSSNINIEKDEIEIKWEIEPIRSESSENITQSFSRSSIGFAENKHQTSQVLSTDCNTLEQNQSDKSVSLKIPFQTPSEVLLEAPPTPSEIAAKSPAEASPKTLSEIPPEASYETLARTQLEPLTSVITDNQLDKIVNTESLELPAQNVKKSSLLNISQHSVDCDLPKFDRPSSYSSLRESKLGRYQSVDSHKYTPNTLVKSDDKIIEATSLQRMQNKPNSFSASDKQYDLPVIYNRFRNNSLSKDTVNEVSVDRQTVEAPIVHEENEKMKKQNEIFSQRREPSLTRVAESSSSMSESMESNNNNTDTLIQNQTIGFSISDTSSEKLTSKPILEHMDRGSKPLSPITTPNDPLKISPGVDSLSKNVECVSTTFVRRGSQRTISSNLLNRLRNFEKPETEQTIVPRKNQDLSQTSSVALSKPSSEMLIKSPNKTLMKTQSEATAASELITRTTGEKLVRTPSETLMQRFDRNRPGSFSVGDRQFEVSKNERSSNYRVRTGHPSNNIISETVPNSSSNNNIQSDPVKISGSFEAPISNPLINMDINGVVIRNKPNFQPKYGRPSSYKRVTNRESNETADVNAANESKNHCNNSIEVDVGSRSSRIDTLKAKFDNQIDRARPGSFSTRDVKYDPPKHSPLTGNRMFRSNTENRSTILNLTPDVSNVNPVNDQLDCVPSSGADSTISSSDDSIEITPSLFPNCEKPSDLRKFNRLPLNYRLRRSGHMPRVSSSDVPDNKLLPLSQIDQNIDLPVSQTPEDKIVYNFRRTRPNSFQASDIQYHQPESNLQRGNGLGIDQNERPGFTRKWNNNTPQNTSNSLLENNQKDSTKTYLIQPLVTPRNDLNNNYVRTTSVLSNVRYEPVPKYSQLATSNSSDQSPPNVSSPNIPTYSSRTSLQLAKPSPGSVDGAALLVKAADSILGTVQRKISIFNYRDLIRTQSVSDKRTEFGSNRARTMDQMQADRVGQSVNVQR